MNTTQTIHCFQQAGLGIAPFQYVGMVDQNIQYGEATGIVNGVEFITKPGSTCDYCGTYILNIFRVKSSDGKKFKVGSKCIRKTDDTDLIRLVDEDLKAHTKKRVADKKIAKEQADATFCLEAIAKGLAHYRHPMPSMAQRGKTLADYAQWMVDNRHYAKLATVIRTA